MDRTEEQGGEPANWQQGAGTGSEGSRDGTEPMRPTVAPERWQTTTTAPGLEAGAGIALLELSVIVPARNEQDCLGACLDSLMAQTEDHFRLGRDWEILVVDDQSTDQTGAIAKARAGASEGVTVLAPDKLERGWTGKANACATAARRARGRWLLFTDADTLHEPGNLRRAIHEAEKHQAGMLSYSPRQIVQGVWQRALMPLIFSELALAYPPAKVSDPATRLAAANGQFLLVDRHAYQEIGGHGAVKGDILEDVQLAFRIKRRKLGLRFRYAPEALSTRMYRNFQAMFEGWSKNLALLFANAPVLALWRLLDLVLLAGLPWLAIELWARTPAPLPQLSVGWVIVALWLRNLWRFYARVARSSFPALDCALSPLALPLFAVLLYRSWFQNKIRKRVSWKGRDYAA